MKTEPILEPKFHDPMRAFDAAIAAGRLSGEESADNFAGGFMYMGTVDGVHQFKNIATRRYLD